MEELVDLLKRCPLFYGIKEDELYTLLKCCAAQEERYEAGELVLRMGEAMNSILIMVEGTAQVCQEDFWGQKEELYQLKEGDIFGQSYSCARTPALPVSVETTGPCRAVFLDYQRMITFCSLACEFHTRLIQNLLRIVARKNLMLNQKIEFISKRSTREKLMAYLTAQAKAADSHTFSIPYNRQELADYLGVERSAMSAELGKLKKEGILDFHKNHFQIRKEAVR